MWHGICAKQMAKNIKMKGERKCLLRKARAEVSTKIHTKKDS